MAESPLRSFGRMQARPLKPRQAALLETLAPRVALPAAGPIELAALGWAQAREGYVLEIGFGAGEHLAGQAKNHPEHGFIGVEPFLNGVASCLRHIEEAGLENVRLHRGDARDVIARLPAAALERVYILFPDPWPKTRHHKRRLIQPGFVRELARVLRPGGDVRFATDWADYAHAALQVFLRDPTFSWTAERASDWTAPWEGHVTTRYEQKRLGDCAPIWLQFERLVQP